MKKLLLLPFTLFAVQLFAQPTWDWGYEAGGAGNDIAYSISTMPTGVSYVTGIFRATAAFGSQAVASSGDGDLFLAKYTPTGSCLWAKHYGGMQFDQGLSVDVDAAGNSYIVGQTNGTHFLFTKYDPSGNQLWVTADTTNNGYARSITVDSAGNSWVTGYLIGPLHTFGSFTLVGSGSFVVKYDPNGVALFATMLGSGSIDLYGIDHDNAGNTYLTGYLQSQDMIGSQTFTSNGMRDAIVLKVDAAGNFVWLRQSWTLGGSITNGNAVCCDEHGGVYICGDYDNTTIIGNDTLFVGAMFGTCFFIARYDANGNAQWAEYSNMQSMGAGQMHALALNAGTNDRVYMTGVFSADVLFGATSMMDPGGGMNTFIAAFDSTGLCHFTIQSTGQNPGAFGQGISSDQFGAVYICGFDKAPVVFGSYTTQFIGGEDAFIARIGHMVKGIDDPQAETHVTLFQSGAQQFQLQLGEQELRSDVHFVLYDMTGRIVKTISISTAQTQIDCSELAKGVYSWSVETTSRIASGKLITY